MKTGRDRGVIALLVIWLLATGLAWAGIRHLPVLGMIERWVGDVRIATLLPAEPQHTDILIIAITEETLERFPYRSPVDRAFLADLLRSLEKKGVRAILLDILLDQPTETAKDADLKRLIREMKTPLVISYAGREERLTAPQKAYIDQFLPLDRRGFANLVKDPYDGTARWIFPGRELADGPFIPGVAAALSAKLGGDAPRERIAISWHGRPDLETEPFRSYPAHMVPVLPEKWLRGKVVLIGSDLSLTDRHRTPFSVIPRTVGGVEIQDFPGVEIHAHALAQLLEGRQPPEPGFPLWISLLLLGAAVGVALALTKITLLWRLLSGAGVIILYWAGGFLLFQQGGELIPILPPIFSFILALGMTDIHIGAEDRRQRKFIRQAFSRYLAPSVVTRLMENPAALSLGGERREMTFLFTDVAGFTTLSEQMDAADLARILNDYLGGICRVILHHEGTVINFIGDAVFALFGAPEQQSDHAPRALNCAREMDRFAESFRRQQAERGLTFGQTRIGLHTGSAAIGNLGSEERFQYTALGDAVNIAARLEGLNKFLGTRICLSAGSADLCPPEETRPVARVVLKGKSQPIDVFEPWPEALRGTPFSQRYRQAFKLLDDGETAAAKTLFDTLRAEQPADHCVALHLKRIESGHRDIHMVMADK